ncbi:MAG TPA: VanW family protein [Symbiobacteriaceae bacterium]|jgi:vancomycin resistance protein VanW|nr:VanW family protein [Symbiobacteriaceae bacterium]
MSPRQIVWRGFLAGAVAAIVGLGALLVYVAWYSGTDRILPGVVVGRTPVGGLSMRQAGRRVARDYVRRPPVLAGGPGAAGGNPVGGSGGIGPQRGKAAGATVGSRVMWQDRTWNLLPPNLADTPDVQGALQSAELLGRSGPMWQRARTFLTGLVHGHYVPLDPHLEQRALEQQLKEIARDVDRPAVNAMYNFESDTATEGQPGQALDVAASMAAIEQAMREGRSEVVLVVQPVEPEVRKQDLAETRREVIARFTTPILAADPGRVQNIAIAVRKISGVALKPGQVFSFNETVGPRDAEHGWAPAKEIYQGEFVLGFGGGICQVSSTLYNAVLLGGLEVKERFHHDRPLQYVDPGRDATVAWNLLDFKFRNSTDMTVLVGARILPGAPQQIEVTLYAPRPVPAGAILLETGDVRYFPPALEELPDPSLPGDAREVVDEGHYGIEVKTYRVFKADGKERKELVSHDRYLPKAGKVRVGVGNAPGSERLLQPGIR